MRSSVVGLVAAAVAVLVVAVGAVLLVASADDGTPIIDLAVGDCFDVPDGELVDGTVASVDEVDCATPHLAEVVGDGSLNPGGTLPYPPDEELFASVDQACRANSRVDSDAFGLLPIAPTPDLWESFDGRFLCVAIPFGGEPVTGSAQGD